MAGDEITIEWEVTNAGAGTTIAESWLDRVYLSSDATFDPQQDYLAAAVLHEGQLEAGESYTAAHTVTLPAGLDGSFHLAVRTDAEIFVEEDVINKAAIFNA